MAAETGQFPHPIHEEGVSALTTMAGADGRPLRVHQFFLRPPGAEEPHPPVEGEDEEDVDLPWSLLRKNRGFIVDGLPRPLTVEQAQAPWTREEEHFRRELLRFVRLQLPSFPTVLQAGVGMGQGLAVYADPGPSLSERVVGDGPMDAEQVREVGRRLIELLRPLHDMRPPLLMPEICPAHFHLDPSGDLRLTTFGELKLLLPMRQVEAAAWRSPFLAPERRRRTGETPASDVYSIGATLYFLAAGCPPEVEPTDVFPVEMLRPGLDPELAQIITTCLQADPSQRYPGLSELRGALKAGTDDEPPPRIEVDRTAIDEAGVPRGAQRGGTITVTNAGGGRLAGRVECDAPWLFVHPHSLEGDPVILRFRIETDGLPRNSRHAARIRLGVQEAPSGTAPPLQPVEIPVSLEVIDERQGPDPNRWKRIVRLGIPVVVAIALIALSRAGFSIRALLERLGLG